MCPRNAAPPSPAAKSAATSPTRGFVENKASLRRDIDAAAAEKKQHRPHVKLSIPTTSPEIPAPEALLPSPLSSSSGSDLESPSSSTRTPASPSPISGKDEP